MTAWIAPVALSAVVLLLLRQSRMVTREGLEIALVAVLAALAGYAWQGSPEMPGHPAAQVSQSAG